MLGIRDEELAVRWLQFGVFSPIMRLHSSISEFLGKEPWNYSLENCSVMERYLRLRHQLVPWLYGQMLKAHQEGSTILYPAYYDWNFGWELLQMQKDEYVFGSEMLVVPIVTPMDKETHLGSAMAWLPEGDWVDFFTGRRYAGGQRMRVYRSIHHIPVFVRPGTVIPLDGAQTPENGCPLPMQLSFRVFAGASGEGAAIEDNGARPGSKEYRRVETRCTITEGEGLTVSIAPACGACERISQERRLAIEIVGIDNVAPDEASCPYETDYDPGTRTLKIRFDVDGVEGATVSWRKYPACPELNMADMVHRLLLPVSMKNAVKDRMLTIAKEISAPERRLAAYMTHELPEGLMGALMELECVR